MTLDAFTPRRQMLALIAVPVLLAAIYFGLLAADRYVSESTVVLRDDRASAPVLTGAASLLSALPGSAQLDTQVLREYMQSAVLAEAMERQLAVRRHFSGSRLDPTAHLAEGATREDYIAFFRDRVEAIYDERSQALKLHVQGLDAPFAQQLNQAVLAASEAFVNESSHKMARERLTFAEAELQRAAGLLEAAQGKVLAFQARHRLIDPTAQAGAASTVVAELSAAITKAETDLRALRSYLQDSAPQVVAARAQLAALRTQLDTERSRATARDGADKRLAVLALEFQGLKLQAQVAEDAYKAALAAVEAARLDATRRLSTLVIVEPPTLPESAQYPRRLYGMATVLACCLLLYAIVRLTVATIREHQD
ncbi:MAG: capsular biosynthesis protein [Burkholderiaceae bacterium]|nr:capsular biosynthesis protein [Rhodoferax sp.]MCP5285806.1 capsular biosynthesis protein [Burkholderiaceae bacterium]